MNHLRLIDRGQLERRVAAWMAEEAPASSTPDDRDIDRILFATSRVRPDPRWLALLKESPMRTTTDAGPRIAVGSPARVLVLAVLLVSLLAAVALAVVASGILKPVVLPSLSLSTSLTWRQTAQAGSFAPLARLTHDPQGRIWVVDSTYGRFAIYQPDGTFVEYWQPSNGPAYDLRRENGDTYGAIAFAADGARFILDVGNFRVLAYDSSGAYTTTWGSEGISPGQFADPVGIAMRPDSSVAVLDAQRGVVETYSRDGTVLSSVTVFTGSSAQFNSSNGFAIDGDGNLYVSQVEAGRVEKFSPTGQSLAIYGETGPGKFTEQPGAIAVDAGGRVYVVQGPFRGKGLGVLVFNADGSYIGGLGEPGNDRVDKLAFPSGILIDGEGNLFVVDSGMPVGNQLVDPSLESYKIDLSASP